MTFSLAHPWRQFFAGLGLSALLAVAVLAIGATNASTPAPGTGVSVQRMDDFAAGGVPQQSAPVTTASALPGESAGGPSWPVVALGVLSAGMLLAAFSFPGRRRGRHGRFDPRGWGA